MGIRKLMSAARAAGYAMAPADDGLTGDPLSANPITDEAALRAGLKSPLVRTGHQINRAATALVAHDPNHGRQAWSRDWLTSFMFGRATA